jgi:protein-L-isoaspartate O-methyltransferase
LLPYARCHDHRFVPIDQRPWAHNDYALPIGNEQTISQSTIVEVVAEVHGRAAALVADRNYHNVTVASY